MSLKSSNFDQSAPRPLSDDSGLVVVLDLDETLIYAAESPLAREPCFVAGPYFVYERPHLSAFLRALEQNYHVALWTASSARYASLVVEKIFPPGYPLLFAWSRAKCTYRLDRELVQPVWSKELRKLWRRGYRRERVVVVDDSPEKLLRNYGNHVQIPPWYGDEDDDALRQLPAFLDELARASDVRTIDKRRWFLPDAPSHA